MDNERLRIQSTQAERKANGGTIAKTIAEAKACEGKCIDRRNGCQCTRVSEAMLSDPVAFNKLFRSL